MKSRTTFMRMAIIVGTVSLLFLVGCGGGTSQSFNNPSPGSNPVPAITNVSPSEIAVGGPSFTLTVSGSHFVSGSVVQWNGSNQTTAFVDSSHVTAQIPAASIGTTGTEVITVFNPAPGGGISNSLTLSIVTSAPGPISIAIAPDATGKFGKFAYVANSRSDNVSMYTIDAMSGALTLIGTISAGTAPASVGIDPSGKFVYVANDGGYVVNEASLSMFTIDGATGALTSIGTIKEACPAALCTAFSVTVHPSGKFAYVANGYPKDNVSMFIVDQATGALTSAGAVDTAFAGSSNSTEIAIDSSGKFAYVASDDCALDTFTGNVSMYTIDSTTGALSFVDSVPAGWCPVSVTVDPLGKFVYVTNHGGDNVAIYTINGTTGALTSTGFVDTGTDPSSVAVDPTGRFAYVTNSASNDVSMYTMNANTGALTSTGRIAAGLHPSSIAIDPSGKFAYVTNSGSNDVSMYSIDATTGALTLIGTIST
jgi:6-phosphogluconolactonase (cycloisomerase 2 family)